MASTILLLQIQLTMVLCQKSHNLTNQAQQKLIISRARCPLFFLTKFKVRLLIIWKSNLTVKQLNYHSIKVLNIIDKEMGMEAEQVNFGKGTEMLVPAPESHSVVDVAKVIKAATAQEKGAPKTEEDLEAVVEDVIENTGLEEFCNEVIEELGKRVLTQNLVPKNTKRTARSRRRRNINV